MLLLPVHDGVFCNLTYTFLITLFRVINSLGCMPIYAVTKSSIRSKALQVKMPQPIHELYFLYGGFRVPARTFR